MQVAVKQVNLLSSGGPSGVISTNQASKRHSLENGSAVESAGTTERPHVVLQQEKRSSDPSHQENPKPTFPAKAELHKEIDSTYTDSMKPISKNKSTSEPGFDSVGSQMASGALTMLYTPVKLVYAGLGGIFGSLAYVLTAGHEPTAQTIWSASLNGDYFFTPAHLRGDVPLQFMGSSEDNSMADTSEEDSYLAQSSDFPK